MPSGGANSNAQQQLALRKAPVMPKPSWHPPWKLSRVISGNWHRLYKLLAAYTTVDDVPLCFLLSFSCTGELTIPFIEPTISFIQPTGEPTISFIGPTDEPTNSFIEPTGKVTISFIEPAGEPTIYFIEPTDSLPFHLLSDGRPWWLWNGMK